MTLPLPTIWAFGLVLFRTAGLCVTAPVLSARGVPMRIRAGLAMAVAWATCAAAGFPQAVVPVTMLQLIGHVVFETVMGLTAGFAARVALDAATAAGQTAGLSMGLGFGALIDPLNGVESTSLGQLLNLAAVSVAVSLGVHREALAWLAQSLVSAPVGLASTGTMMLQHLVLQIIASTSLAMRLGLPLMAAVTLGHMTLGLIGRATPHLPLSSLGFSVAILAGGGALYALLPGIAQLAAESALHAFGGR